jgi:uncharacterized membrane protein YccF (DUF307 family)
MAATSTHVREDPGFPFVIRVLWFVLIGWHVTLYWIVIAWLLNLTIIGMPLGLWMLNRAPLVLTLRAPRGYTVAQVQNGEVVRWDYRSANQPFFLIRLVYFLLIGWWFSLLWSLLAWLLCVSIIGLPLGVWMLNRLPAVTTMMRM